MLNPQSAHGVSEKRMMSGFSINPIQIGQSSNACNSLSAANKENIHLTGLTSLPITSFTSLKANCTPSTKQHLMNLESRNQSCEKQVFPPTTTNGTVNCEVNSIGFEELLKRNLVNTFGSASNVDNEKPNEGIMIKHEFDQSDSADTSRSLAFAVPASGINQSIANPNLNHLPTKKLPPSTFQKRSASIHLQNDSLKQLQVNGLSSGNPFMRSIQSGGMLSSSESKGIQSSEARISAACSLGLPLGFQAPGLGERLDNENCEKSLQFEKVCSAGQIVSIVPVSFSKIDGQSEQESNRNESNVENLQECTMENYLNGSQLLDFVVYKKNDVLLDSAIISAKNQNQQHQHSTSIGLYQNSPSRCNSSGLRSYQTPTLRQLEVMQSFGYYAPLQGVSAKGDDEGGVVQTFDPLSFREICETDESVKRGIQKQQQSQFMLKRKGCNNNNQEDESDDDVLPSIDSRRLNVVGEENTSQGIYENLQYQIREELEDFNHFKSSSSEASSSRVFHLKLDNKDSRVAAQRQQEIILPWQEESLKKILSNTKNNNAKCKINSNKNELEIEQTHPNSKIVKCETSSIGTKGIEIGEQSNCYLATFGKKGSSMNNIESNINSCNIQCDLSAQSPLKSNINVNNKENNKYQQSYTGFGGLLLEQSQSQIEQSNEEIRQKLSSIGLRSNSHSRSPLKKSSQSSEKHHQLFLHHKQSYSISNPITFVSTSTTPKNTSKQSPAACTNITTTPAAATMKFTSSNNSPTGQIIQQNSQHQFIARSNMTNGTGQTSNGCTPGRNRQQQKLFISPLNMPDSQLKSQVDLHSGQQSLLHQGTTQSNLQSKTITSNSKGRNIIVSPVSTSTTPSTTSTSATTSMKYQGFQGMREISPTPPKRNSNKSLTRLPSISSQSNNNNNNSTSSTTAISSKPDLGFSKSKSKLEIESIQSQQQHSFSYKNFMRKIKTNGDQTVKAGMENVGLSNVVIPAVPSVSQMKVPQRRKSASGVLCTLNCSSSANSTSNPSSSCSNSHNMKVIKLIDERIDKQVIAPLLVRQAEVQGGIASQENTNLTQYTNNFFINQCSSNNSYSSCNINNNYTSNSYATNIVPQFTLSESPLNCGIGGIREPRSKSREGRNPVVHEITGTDKDWKYNNEIISFCITPPAKQLEILQSMYNNNQYNSTNHNRINKEFSITSAAAATSQNAINKLKHERSKSTIPIGGISQDRYSLYGVNIKTQK